MEAGDLTSTAPRSEGRWTGRMNPFHESSSTGLGIRCKVLVLTGVGGWENEKRPKTRRMEARRGNDLMIVLVIVQVSKRCDGAVHKKARPRDRSLGCFQLGGGFGVVSCFWLVSRCKYCLVGREIPALENIRSDSTEHFKCRAGGTTIINCEYVLAVVPFTIIVRKTRIS